MKKNYNETEHKEKINERCFPYSKKRCAITLAACAVVTIMLVLVGSFALSSSKSLGLMFFMVVFAAFILLTGLLTALFMRRDYLIRVDDKGIHYWKRFHISCFPWEWLSDYELKYAYSGMFLVLYYNENGLKENNRIPGRKGTYRRISECVSLSFSDNPDEISKCIGIMNPHPMSEVTANEYNLRRRAKAKERILYVIAVAAFVVFLVWSCFAENDGYFVFGKVVTYIAVIITFALLQALVIGIHRKVWYHSNLQTVPALIISTVSIYLLCAIILLGADFICGYDNINAPILQWFVYDVFVNFSFVPTRNGLANMVSLLLVEPGVYCCMMGWTGAELCANKLGSITMKITSVAAAMAILILSLKYLSNVLAFI